MIVLQLADIDKAQNWNKMFIQMLSNFLLKLIVLDEQVTKKKGNLVCAIILSNNLQGCPNYFNVIQCNKI